MYSEDFIELDKSNFKCYKFPSGDIYYGEVAYMNPEGRIVTEPSELNDDEIKPTLKLVRHGNGVQLFGIDEQKTECKYEGSWEKNKKKGRGTAHFPDGSIYEGEFDNDVFEGNGKFIWKAGHVYIGAWRQGRMEGDGEFKHQDGHIMRGTFKNNYMLDKEKNIYLNPFLCADDSDVFRDENIKYAEFLSKTKKQFTSNNVKVVYNNDEIISYMADCFNNNMTPLLVRTVERMVGKEELLSYLPSEYVEIDLKYYYLKLREFHLDSKEVKMIYEEIQAKFVDAMVNGKYLVLNYDDCAVQYDELFEPDLKEISGNLMFSPFLFTPQTFAEDNVFISYAKGRKDITLNPDFKFVVYSRYLITDVNADQEELKMIIERKFKKSFPLKFMNVFVLSKPKVEEQQQQEVNEEEEKKETETVVGAKMLSSQSKKK